MAKRDSLSFVSTQESRPVLHGSAGQEDQLDTAVFGPSLSGPVAHDRLILTESFGRQLPPVHALVDEVLEDALRALL